MTDDLEDWAKKCLSCIHCYKKKDDADYLYCRLKKVADMKQRKIRKVRWRNEKD